MEGYQLGGGEGGKVQGIRSIIGRQNRWGEVKNGIENKSNNLYVQPMDMN